MRLLCVLLIFFLYSFPIITHDFREDSKKIYKRPIEVITQEKQNELEKYLQENSEKPYNQIEQIKSLLNEYYAQFVEEKRILDIREKAGKYKDRKDEVTDEYKNNSGIIPVNADVNSIRLFISGMRFKNTESHLARDSDLLYDLHLKLAKLYEKVGEKHKAVEFYLSGLRYRDFSNSEERYYDPNLLEELGQEEVNNRLSHKKIKTALDETNLELKKTQAETHLIGSRFAKRELSESEANGLLSENSNKISSLKESLKQKESDYNDSLKNNFGNYLNKKNVEDSTTILDFAKLVKQIENENKEREKIQNRSENFGKGIFVVADTNRNQNFFGFSELLEYSIKINPNNSEAVSLLAEEYKSSGKKRNAVDMYLKYLRLASLPENNGKLPVDSAYKNLAQLYSDLKQYVVASYYYEKLIEIRKTDSKQDPDLNYQIGDFYAQKLGNLERASEFYMVWLNWLDQARKDEQTKREQDKEFGISLEETLRRLSFDFTASYYIAQFQKTRKYPDEEILYLDRAYNAYKDIEKLLKEYETNVSNSKKDVDLLKRDLLNKTTADSLSIYKEEQNKLEESNYRLKSIKTVYDSIRKTNLLFRMTVVEEENRNFKRLKNLYEEIVNVGNENEIANALRNLERVKKIEADGISRRRIVH